MKNQRTKKIYFLLIFSLFVFHLSAQSKLLSGSKYSSNPSYLLDLFGDDLAPASLPFSSKMTQISFGLYDEIGDITFYTNGCNVYNVQDLPLLENSFHKGTELDSLCTLYGGIIRNGTVLLGDPNNENTIFTIYLKGKLGGSNSGIINTGLYLRTLNIEEKTWKDEVEIKTGHLSSFSHKLKGDGSGYWLIIADLESNDLLTYDITNESVTLINSLSFPLSTSIDECPFDLNLKFSPDGKKIAFHHSSCYLAIYDFDECSGISVGPRVNFSGGSSDNPNNTLEFTKDSRFLILGSEKYQPSSRTKVTSNEVLIYDIAKIGVRVDPIYSLETPINFSLGSIFTNIEDRIVIFNRFSDHYYLDLKWSSESSTIIDSSFKRLPFRYYPAFSTLERQNPLPINNCINATYYVSSDQFKLYPNPASDHFVIGYENDSSEKWVVNIVDETGRFISRFITENHEPIQTNGLIVGSYTISIFSLKGKHLTTKKIIIAR